MDFDYQIAMVLCSQGAQQRSSHSAVEKPRWKADYYLIEAWHWQTWQPQHSIFPVKFPQKKQTTSPPEIGKEGGARLPLALEVLLETAVGG